MDVYQVKKLVPKKEYQIEVPGSKSITNRALLLAALSNKSCTLKGVLFSDDTRGFMNCLCALGFELQIEEKKKEVKIQGTGGRIPNRDARINVRSAGTAARFLTVMLALGGGHYEIMASEQMSKRPMQTILEILERTDIKFKYNNEPYHLPLEMWSDGLKQNEIVVDTDVSSQYASALLMAGVMVKNGLKLSMNGDRSEGAYIKMTLQMMQQFGIQVIRDGNHYTIPQQESFGLTTYQVEPDISAACYFYTLAPLLNTSVIVKNVHADSIQGDIRYLEILHQIGCKKENLREGIRITGDKQEGYPGLEVSMKDFSDQTMTLASLAPFLLTPVLINDISHIRFQESDRMQAILNELSKMGIQCEENKDKNGIIIYPGKIQPTVIETYQDHRMAMAFTLPGLRTGTIQIKDPMCCSKTFENYYEVIESLYE